MATTRVEEIYEQYVRPLTPAEQVRLIAMAEYNLAHSGEHFAKQPKRNILELHGLGAALWQGTDAQEYVNKLRDGMGSHAVIKLDAALAGVTRLGVDTAPIIYYIEANPWHDARVISYNTISEKQICVRAPNR